MRERNIIFHVLTIPKNYSGLCNDVKKKLKKMKKNGPSLWPILHLLSLIGSLYTSWLPGIPQL